MKFKGTTKTNWSFLFYLFKGRIIMKRSIVKKTFGENLCSDMVLKKYMNIFDFKKYLKLKNEGLPLDEKTAKSVALGMKRWAISKGVTHYSHWFSPLTGKTAEKQVTFLERDRNGNMIEVFDEKSLIKSEADASSFPNGGERMTFEARGYIMWDYTSPAFIKEDEKGGRVLYIPTAFCSYTGTALDEKTPLLRALESLNKEAVRVLGCLGYNDVKRVVCNVGGEQEYFLIDKNNFDKRLDLKLVGRTVLGKAPLKSQENCSHYFGIIDDTISAFMNEVDRELWKLGIMTKIRHNEVAPKQRELVPIFAPANISSDENQLLMEVISKVAKRHGFEALFHEAPFKNINGSGKHINWSLSTDTGINLFDSKIADKNLFMLFFSSMISGLHKHYKLIRASMAHRGNDLRLGGNEAPPRIISMFVGENIEKMFETANAENCATNKILNVGVGTIASYEKDYSDRNRTTPVSYNGNKIEFRMVGSSQTMSWPCACICTILANELRLVADELESAPNKQEKLCEIIKNNYENHKDIIYDGNGYSQEWKEEAKRRGLVEIINTLEALDVYDDDAVVSLFENCGVLSHHELEVRKAVHTKAYFETVCVEAKTMLKMIKTEVFPAIVKTLESFGKVKALGEFSNEINRNAKLLAVAYDHISLRCEYLEKLLNKIDKNSEACVIFEMLNVMENVREIYDGIEEIIPKTLMPFPIYDDILF